MSAMAELGAAVRDAEPFHAPADMERKSIIVWMRNAARDALADGERDAAIALFDAATAIDGGHHYRPRP